MRSIGQPDAQGPEVAEPTEEGFLEVLDLATEAVRDAGVPFVVIGSIASAALGRPRWNPRGADVDLFVRAEDAERSLEALAFGEQTPSYWHEALGIIARGELDWDYVLYRARHGTRRILSLLLYAQSNDLPVPPRAVRELFDLTEGGTSQEPESWNTEPKNLPTT